MDTVHKGDNDNDDDDNNNNIIMSHQRHYELCVNQYDMTVSVNSKLILISPSFS